MNSNALGYHGQSHVGSTPGVTVARTGSNGIEARLVDATVVLQSVLFRY